MNLQSIYHVPKSNYAYAYTEHDLDIRLRTAKNDCTSVNLVIAQKYHWQNKKTFPMEKVASDRLFDYYQYRYHADDTRLGYYFEISDGKSTVVYSESGFTKEFDDKNAYFHYFQYPYINKTDLHRIPDWVHSTVFYQIFVDRFYNGDHSNDPKILEPWGKPPTPQSFYGGDLQGILEKLPYLQELGINGIYLTPIFQSPSNHKYDTTDYRKVDESFGTKELLCTLVKKAHQMGIRVVLDGVFNHCCWTFPPFQDVLKNGEKSPYKDWFHIDSFPVGRFTEEEAHDYTKPLDSSRLNYRVFGISPSMPKLNTENPELKKYLLDTVAMWTKDTGIDGWRLDVSDEVNHGFWRDFRKTVKEINPEALILGENWHNAYPWLQGDQFDSVMNYPVTKCCIQFFAEHKVNAEQFAGDLYECLMHNTEQVNYAMLNLLDSHDTMRFLTWCGGNKRLLRMAVMFLFSYVGMPCIYYGSEIGMEGGGDPDCRRTFDWNRENWDLDLFHFYQKVISLRRNEKALQYGTIRMYAKDDVFYLVRSYKGSRLVTVINNTSQRKAVSLHNDFEVLLGKEDMVKDTLMPYSGCICRLF
ncbi:glycoside hydrolase family 13 protein [[Clostridium] cellulosi]